MWLCVLFCLVFHALVGTCEETEFSCITGGQCVSNSVQCDGVEDCDDGTEEYLCSE